VSVLWAEVFILHCSAKVLGTIPPSETHLVGDLGDLDRDFL
jgi:hypothetical protein